MTAATLPTLPPVNHAADLAPLVPVYRAMLLSVLDGMIERFDPAYGYIDTKLDIFTGQAIAPSDGPTDLFGRDTVYAWIQSRGVESLYGHARWISEGAFVTPEAKARYAATIPPIVASVIARLEKARQANGGSLFFWFTPDGTAFTLDREGRRVPLPPAPGTVYLSNEYHVKAMLAAARFLDDPVLEAAARDTFRDWYAAVKAGRVVGDQQPFDPKNPVAPIPGRISHAVYMISLSAFALYAAHFPDREYVEGGFDCIRHLLDHHVNIDNRFPKLAPLDFLEYITPDDRPFEHDGAILSDPGHGLEIVGFAFKFINIVRHRTDLTPAERDCIAMYDELLPRFLLHVYEQGHNPKGGIYKMMDLVSRKPYNDGMPWWNLPETMRAAMYGYNAASGPDLKSACLRVVREASNDFLRMFVRPEVHMMAYQTLDRDGTPVKVVPATPDLDPGYHTGLSIIDFLAAMEEAQTRETQA